MTEKYSIADLVDYYIYYKDVVKPAIDKNPDKYAENFEMLMAIKPRLTELLNHNISDFLILKVTEALILCKEY